MLNYSHMSVGIFLGNTMAEASLIRMRKGGGFKRIGSSTVVAGSDFWDEGCLDAVIAQVFSDLPGKSQRADVAVQISLPDPLVYETLMDFEDFPQNPAEATKLVTWRMARAIDVAAETLRCSFQIVGEGAAGRSVIGRSVTTEVFDAVYAAAKNQGVRIARLDGWSGYHFNHIDEADICVWANEEWWVLECRGKGEASFIASGWIKGCNPESRIADRVTRLARSYVLKTSAKPVRISLLMPGKLEKIMTLKLSGDDLLNVSPIKGEGLDPSVLVALL